MARMSASQIEEAARLLLEARRSGKKLEALPEPFRPDSVEDGYAIQQTVARHLGAIAGWKVGAPNTEATPLCGPIFAAGLKPSPATLSGPEYPLRGLEAEVAFLWEIECSHLATPLSLSVPHIPEFSTLTGLLAAA